MLFNSFNYIFIFLPLVITVYYALLHLTEGNARLYWLTLASLYFYADWSLQYLPLLIGSALVNFLIGHVIEAGLGRRNIYLWLGVVLNLSLLAIFKYLGFIIDQFNLLCECGLPQFHVVLPIGISFFTFTQIAYLVDLSRGVSGHYDLVRYVLFVSFFPHLLAGPILHHREMMPQFARKLSLAGYERQISYGLLIFAIGLFKKVCLADPLSPVANAAFAAADKGEALSAGAAWWGALAYTLQLYFDFSGYSDMAIGGARFFGIILPFNFNAPYRATSFIDFWRRWHMTLSRFLRDYLYIPLGGNRRGATQRYLNILLTMLLGGIWHGAGYGFVIWGGAHGILLGLNHAWRSLRPSLPLPPTYLEVLLGWLVTFVCVVVSWVFFRASTLSGAERMIAAMFGQYGWASLDVIVPLTQTVYELKRIPPSSLALSIFDVVKLELPAHPILGATLSIFWLAPLLILAITGPTSQQFVTALMRSARSRSHRPRLLSTILAAFIGALFVFTLTQLNHVTEFLYFQF